MKLSELSVKRPVFAAVISLMLVILGLLAAQRLPVRELPDVESPVVSVETNYLGASADVVETKITQVLEERVAGLEGITKITSQSTDGRSSINIEFDPDRSVDEAANDVRDRVARVMDDLPPEADPPEVGKVDFNAEPVIWLVLSSDTMNALELTDFAERELVDRFSVLPGVARVRMNGARRYAMRVWIDREALAARQMTVADVEAALRRENVQLPAGRLESSQRELTLRTETGLNTEAEFRQLAIGRGADGYLVRLGEVADVRLSAENERSLTRTNGVPGLSIGVEQISKANTIAVARAVRAERERVVQDLPEGTRLEVNLDRSVFIEESMKEVVEALVIAMALVIGVIYVFLGNARATLVPAVTIPVSIIAAFVVMAALGFSINTLTLLGLVLAIGLVVDDAIVVLENIYRRMERGEPSLVASVDGSREIGFAVVATTLVLVAVFVPMSFLEGNVGKLFREFGFTIAAAVAFSALIALTLTPMLTSKLFARGVRRSRMTEAVEAFFARLSAWYDGVLRGAMRRPWFVVLGAIAATGLAAVLLRVLPSELAPSEDRGFMMIGLNGPEGASLDYMDRHARAVEGIVRREIETGEVVRLNIRVPGAFGGGAEMSQARGFVLLAPWDDRERTADQVAQSIRGELNKLPGVRGFVTIPGGWAQGQGAPVQVVLQGTEYADLVQYRDLLMDRMGENPGLTNVNSNYEERKPQLNVAVDRNRAADLGVSLQTVSRTLETVLGSRIVTTFIDRDREYSVILQGRAEDRATPADLDNLYVRSDRSGELVPLSNLVQLTELAGPTRLNRFDRLRSITVSAALVPGYTLGEALQYVEGVVERDMPPSVKLGYDGQSREFKQSGTQLYWMFVLALVIVFLVLAALFESFLHPFIIITTVPLAIIGALVGLWLYGMSINVFSQIAAIMLVGLAAKNGILIVEFANQLRDRGVDHVEAVIEAAAIRLRPVLMTSFCTAFGALPLMLASGAGAQALQAIGVVVFYGVVISVLLTLLVVPAVYALVARNTRSPQAIAQQLERLRTRLGQAQPAPDEPGSSAGERA
ncbi:MAG TPA: efflux RND transporter permease subunit [Steroidobacteraceae bacterium]|nr:efflux RND transporter permease subunit [Steroidobacteraceae bacterium]